MDNREAALLLNSTSDGIIVIDRSRRITVFNPAAEEILKISASASLGSSIESVIPVTRLPVVLETGTNELQQRLSWKSVTIITNRYALRDSDGQVFAAAAIFRDISELQRLAEEITNLREIRLLNDAIFNSTQDAISVVDERGNGVLVNPAYTRVTGLTQEEVIGKPCTVDIAGGESIHMAVLRTGEPVRNRRLRVGPYRRDVVVDANPIVVDGEIRGSVAVIKDVSELRQLHDQLEDAKATIRKLEARYTFEDVVGEHPAFLAAVHKARVAAGTPATVLLQGESGTGKELFAHAIHNASERRNARFVRVNCAALSEGVLESELFGYVGGAFTGARRDGRRGLFEEAHGGTIFLDEVGLMSLTTQAKLLRVLQEHEVRRVGGNHSIPINVRVIAATNMDLTRAIGDATFREDLFYRLLVVPVTIPALRDRAGDIGLLCNRLLSEINAEYGRGIQGISPAAMEHLTGYAWPGNVRELENVLRRAVVVMGLEETVVEPEHLPLSAGAGDGCADGLGSAGDTRFGETAPPSMQESSPGRVGSTGGGAPRGDRILSLARVVAETEHQHIRTVLAECDGNRTRCAGVLGISVRTLQYKLQRYGIS
ncbi:MAG: sigma-54-dependent Fis family transcriptional regulator [Alkalispirochaeta sp.]